MSTRATWIAIGVAALPMAILCMLRPPVFELYLLTLFVFGVCWQWSAPGFRAPEERRRRAHGFLVLTILFDVMIPVLGAELYFGYLLLGWIPFVIRTVPKTRLDPAALALAGICLLALIAGLHAFARSLFNPPAENEIAIFRAWRPKWTFAILASVFLLFASGLASYGLLQSGKAFWELRNE